MSDFVIHEASEDSDSDAIEVVGGGGSNTATPAKRKEALNGSGPVKKRKTQIESSSEDSDEEEEEDEEDKIHKEMAGFVDDAPIEEENDVESEVSDEEEEEDEEDEEDLALIQENIGINIRKKKTKRVIMESSEEEDEGGHEAETSKKNKKKKKEKSKRYDKDREQIAEDLFGGDVAEAEEEDEVAGVDEQEVPSTVRHREDDGKHLSLPHLQHDDEVEDEEGSEVSEGDSFIVSDDEGGEGEVRRKKDKSRSRSHGGRLDPQMREAREIFGDFDFTDLGDDFSDEDLEEQQEEGAPPKPPKVNVLDHFDPAELAKAYLTPYDEEIKIADLPERFQLRRIPVQHTDNELELAEEAEWIYANAFASLPISVQTMEGAELAGRNKDHSTCVPKIQKALHYIRTKHFEVPFIAFYRKEYVEPELTIKDLWRIYHYDEKFTALRARKNQLVRLMQRIQTYQYELYSVPNVELTPDVRPLTEDDIQRVQNVTSNEEFEDVYNHFGLYYGHHVAAARRADRRKAALEGATGEDAAADPQPSFRYPVRHTPYLVCTRAGLAAVAQQYGLTASQLGANLSEKFHQYDIEQSDIEPFEFAREYVCPRFPKEEDVLKGTRYLVAAQIAAEPLVRKVVRDAMHDRAKVFVRATKRGFREIDENHPCFALKYLKAKPIKMLTGDQFLHLESAEKDGLLTMRIAIDDYDEKHANPDILSQSQAAHTAGFNRTYFEEIKYLYEADAFARVAQLWNTERAAALEMALNSFLYPQLERELRAKLAEEAKEVIYKACQRKMYHLIKMAPYPSDTSYKDDWAGYMDDNYNRGNLSVIGVYQAPVYGHVGYAALINPYGELLDHLPLGTSFSAGARKTAESREVDVAAFKQFVTDTKPTVIAVGVDSRDSMYFHKDISALVREIQSESGAPTTINCEIVDTEAALIYAASSQSRTEFRDQPAGLKTAVGLGRLLHDPLLEFVKLVNPEDDILCLKLHPLQSVLDKDRLLDYLTVEFVNRVNEVGVDLNEVLEHPHMIGLVQFICGLGPRKASYALKQLKSHGMLLTRAELVTSFNMGPCVFLNCAGFIRIDVDEADTWWEAHRNDEDEEDIESPVERLDATRVHPEAYEWARKMAIDALELDENTNQREAVRKIMENPERLKDLDLDAFAAELERQNFGTKHTTLYDIRAELNQPYKDLRPPYKPVNPEELFQLVTKETPETFQEGKLVQANVNGFAFRRPRPEELEGATPIKNEDNATYRCPFCSKVIEELADVWRHFDDNSCEGRKVGVKCRLDNGCNGFVSVKMLSDRPPADPEERVRIGMTLWARILKIDIERFQVDLTSRSSDLSDVAKYVKKDSFWDERAENEDKHLYRPDNEVSTDGTAAPKKQVYMKRVIAHPHFRNITFYECEALLADMPVGEAIIRPSSQGPDHLTVTWKVADGIFQHVDIIEREKQNVFSIGKKLEIKGEEYEDLDEIMARFVQPMGNHVREVTNYKYYKDADGGDIDQLSALLYEVKSQQPAQIPYYLSVSKTYPGKFILSYMPRSKPRHELVTVNPEGFRYRTRQFPSLGHMIKWFKEHFDDPVPAEMLKPVHNNPPLRTPVAHGATPVASSYTSRANAVTGSSQFAVPNAPYPPFPSASNTSNAMPQYATAKASYSSSATSGLNSYSTPGSQSQTSQGGGGAYNSQIASLVATMNVGGYAPPSVPSNLSSQSSQPPYQQYAQSGGNPRSSSYVRPAAPQVPPSIPRYQQPSGYKR